MCLDPHMNEGWGWRRETGLSLPVKYDRDRPKAVLLVWIIFVIYVLCVMLLRIFIAAMWSPAGIGLTSWLLFVMFNCVFVTFPCGILGQMWYLILSIPDHCRLSYLCCLKVHCRDTVCSLYNMPSLYDMLPFYGSILYMQNRLEHNKTLFCIKTCYCMYQK